MVELEAIPRELREQPNWVCWRLETRDGKQTKVPYVARVGALRRASSTDPRTWTTFEKAVAVADGYSGVGFVVTKESRVVGADLDHCLNGRIDPWARDAVATLASYTEVTPSGEGLRVFVFGELPPGARKVGNLELYDSGRFLTVTGNHYDDTPLTIEERTTELATVHARMVSGVGKPGALVVPSASQPLSDDELIRKACGANDGGKFAQLWLGAGGYPSASEGDLALCNGLAYWTDGDANRMDRLFRVSNRMRPKWDERHGERTIGERTIAKALESYRARFPAGQVATAVQATIVRPTEGGDGIRSLRELMGETLPPPEHVVSGWLDTGMVILAGKPKLGKSWLMLATALAVSCGGTVMGRLTVDRPRDTLYLALEDTKRRLQDRVRKILGIGGVAPERFDYVLTCPKLNEGGLEQIGTWLEGKGPGALVVVDVWKRVKPKPEKGANAYDADYDAAAMLQTLALKHRACIVVVHHTNKIKSEDDTDIISGSIGFSGAADGHMVLLKSGKNGALLRGSSRDVEPFDWALEWNVEVATWSITGDADEVEGTRLLREAVDLIAEFGKPLTPSDYAAATGVLLNVAKLRLWRWARSGHVVSMKDGTYYTTRAPSSTHDVTHVTGETLRNHVTPSVTPVTPVTRLHAVTSVTSESQKRVWEGDADEEEAF